MENQNTEGSDERGTLGIDGVQDGNVEPKKVVEDDLITTLAPYAGLIFLGSLGLSSLFLILFGY